MNFKELFIQPLGGGTHKLEDLAMKKISFKNPLLLSMILVFLIQACNSSEFKGSSDKPKRQAMPTLSSEPASGASLSPGALSFSPGLNGIAPGDQYFRPLSIYFTLDVTGSMQVVLDAIKTNIVSFSNQLREKKFDTKFGIVTFRDAVQDVFPLSADVSAFQSFLGSQTAFGGDDANEAALSGINTALKNLLSEENRPNATKAILVITDNPAHAGGGNQFERDCRLDPVRSEFDRLNSENQQYVKLFDSSFGPGDTPGTLDGPWPISFAPLPCSGFNTPREQFQSLRDQILLGEEVSKRGGSLPWPFSGETLVNNFSALLEETRPPANLICLAKSATLFVNEQSYLSWSATSMKDVYNLFKSGQELVMKNNLSANEITLIKTSGRLEVTHCCVLPSSAETGSFTQCVKEEKQQINLSVK